MDLGFEVPASEQVRIANVLRQLRPQLAAQSVEEIIKKTPKEDLLAAIARLQGLPLLTTGLSNLIDPVALENFELNALRRGLFVPISINSERLTIAIANPFHPVGLDYCQQEFGERQEVIAVMAPHAEITNIIERRSSKSLGVTSREELQQFTSPDQAVREREREFDLTEPPDESDTLGKVLYTIFSEAVGHHASDIHFVHDLAEHGKEQRRFYADLRIHGVLGSCQFELPPALMQNLNNRLLDLIGADRNSAKNAISVDGRFTLVRTGGRRIDCRFVRIKTCDAYYTVIRLLDKSMVEPKLGVGTMEFDPETLLVIEEVLTIPAGIILMTGPTGSGKSTTLGAMIRHVQNARHRLITVENPVEDRIRGVIQCEMQGNKDATDREAAEYIRALMRGDPDKLMVGEIRDKTTAELAMEAALTGHVVFATLHANSARGAFARLQQLGVESWKIGETVRATMAQRLVRMLCTCHQTQGDGAGRSGRRLTEKEMRICKLPKDKTEALIHDHNPEGCVHCLGSGYSHRAAVLEVLPVTEEARELLYKGESSAHVERAIRERYPMLPTLRDAGLKLLWQGKTDLEALCDVIDLTIQ